MCIRDRPVALRGRHLEHGWPWPPWPGGRSARPLHASRCGLLTVRGCARRTASGLTGASRVRVAPMPRHGGRLGAVAARRMSALERPTGWTGSVTRTDDLLTEIKDQLVALQRQVSSLTEWQEYVRQNQRTRQRVLL